MRRAGDLLAAEFTNKPSPQVTRRLGSVVSASEDGTATVLLDGDEAPTVGVRLVASCASVAVGDRVVVDSYLNMSIITGVLAWSLDSGLGTATPTTDGLMSAADKAKLDGIGVGAKAYGNATTSAAGLMSAADKTKLNGIATGANKYTLPAATASTRGGVKVGSGLKISGDVLSVDNGAYVKLLWSGKTTGGVALNETAANFRFLVVSIGGSDGVVEGSTLVASPNGKTFDVTATFFISGGASIASIRSFRARCTVSGTKLTRGETQQFNGSTVTNGNVYLLSVVGIR